LTICKFLLKLSDAFVEFGDFLTELRAGLLFRSEFVLDLHDFVILGIDLPLLLVKLLVQLIVLFLLALVPLLVKTGI